MKPYYRQASKILVMLLCLAAAGQPALANPIELSLEDSIALALRNNQAVKIADFSRNQSFAALNQAKADKGFNLSFTHTDKRYDGYSTRLYYLFGIEQYVWTNKYDNLLTLSLPIYSGGKLESQIDEAKLNLKIADLNVDATKQQLRQTVTTNYFSVLQCQNNLQVSQQTVDNYEKHLKNVQLQFEVGTVAKSDVLASQVSLSNAQDGLIKARNNYQLAVANLNNTVGLPLDTSIKLKEDLKYEAYSRTLGECEKYALVNRPEMAQYKAKVDIARADMNIAKSGYRPTVSFIATEDWYDSNFPGSDNNNWLVGLTTTFNVFDSGLTKAKIDQAKNSLSSAMEQASQKRDAILLEVRQYYLSMQEAEARIETSKAAVEQAEENLRIAEVRYNAGVGTNLEILDAVLSLNTVETNNIQALYDYNTNKAQLERAIGITVK